MRIALAAIVKPTEDEGKCLARMLGSVAAHVDGIFITQAGEKPSEYVSSVLKMFGAHESFYKWDKSFANARNYNFAQVPKDYDYIVWFDADDVVDGADKLRATIEAYPSVDTFSLWYNYAFDEWGNPVVVHHKTRIVRNDGSIHWVGDLHEDFAADRQLESKHVEGIVVNHMTDDARVEIAKARNVEVARAALSDDPRSYWNLGNALKANGENEEALSVFRQFLARSHSDDEKYIVRLRQAEIYWAQGAKDMAVETLQMAIGMKPDYPDAYVQLGRAYYDLGRYEDALRTLKLSLTLKPPYYKIIVFNPMDYGYTPLKWLAYTYIALNQPMLALPCFEALLEITPQDDRLKQIIKDMKPKALAYRKMLARYNRMKSLTGDKLKAALDSLPDDFKSAPMFCNLRNKHFIKTESSGRDIVFMCGYTTFEWNPTIADTKGVGGSEEAVIHLARNLAARGWNVEVYCMCGHKEEVYDGVTYKPFWMWNYRDKQDVVVLWRHPKMADYEINADKIILDLHDVLPAGELTEKRLQKIDTIFVKSQFHRSLYPTIPEEKFVVVPNGIVADDYAGDATKDPFLLVNTSSPDRSLSKLVKLFKRVKERVPEAKCEWAYGWTGFEENVARRNPDAAKWMDELKAEIAETDGFIERGRVSQREVIEMYRRGRILAYPTEFAEIDCISARKAQALGCLPITTDFAALKETVQYGVKLPSAKTKDTWAQPYQFDYAMSDALDDAWVDAVVAELQKPYEKNTGMREAMAQFDWSKVTDTWELTLSGKA